MGCHTGPLQIQLVKVFAGIQTLFGHCSLSLFLLLGAGRWACVPWRGANDAHRGRAVTDGPLTKYGQAHSCCITIARECNSWLSPSPRCCLTPSSVPAHRHTRLFFLCRSAVTLLFVCTLAQSSSLLIGTCCRRSDLCVRLWEPRLLCQAAIVKDLARLASAVVSNGSADKNMAQLISKCFGIKGWHIHVPHLALVVKLGLRAVLLIQAVCAVVICKQCSTWKL